LAWFPENNGGFLVVYIKNSSDWMLWRIYICISARAILSLILGHGDQLQAAMFWFGVGSAIASLSFCGPKLAPFITIKRSWPWI
jgi:hypothetical protein